MSKYYAKQISKTIWNIQASKTKVGFIRKQDDGSFLAKIGEVVETGASMSIVFQAVCKAQNRINICGENDQAKASAEIRRQNTETLERVAEFNKNALSDISGVRMTTRKSRVNI